MMTVVSNDSGHKKPAVTKTESSFVEPNDNDNGGKTIILEALIIGAGPAGLIAAKSLLDVGIDSIQVIEETSSAGGLWNRANRQPVPCQWDCDANENVKPSQNNSLNRIQTSPQPVYEDLRSNFPKDMTSFLGYPFPSALEWFPNASQVCHYYQQFARDTGVNQLIQYSCLVEHCTKVQVGDNFNNGKTTNRNIHDKLWKIQTRNTQTDIIRPYYSKHLIVCNGHFRRAYIPHVPGLLEHYQGKLLHSSAFESVRHYAGKTVLIVGGSISALDIAYLLLKKGTNCQVILSMRSFKTIRRYMMSNLVQQRAILKPAISHMDDQGRIHFYAPPQGVEQYYDVDIHDKSTMRWETPPDAIIFATGYRYHLTFLEQHLGTSDNNLHVMRQDGYKMERLYRRVLSIDDPTLTFVGITNGNLSPAIVMEYQAQWVAQLVAGRLMLPSHQEMLTEVQSRSNDPTQDTLYGQFFGYCNSLARDINIRGYWSQVLWDRVPLMMKTYLTRRHQQRRSDGSKVPFMTPHDDYTANKSPSSMRWVIGAVMIVVPVMVAIGVTRLTKTRFSL